MVEVNRRGFLGVLAAGATVPALVRPSAATPSPAAPSAPTVLSPADFVRLDTRAAPDWRSGLVATDGRTSRIGGSSAVEDPHTALHLGPVVVVLPIMKPRGVVYAWPDLSVVRILGLPPGLMFSGHAVLDRSGETILASVFDTRAGMTGVIAVIAIDGWRLLELRPTGGLGPHGMVRAPDGSIWIAHFGVSELYKDAHRWHAVDTKITRMDAECRRVLEEFRPTRRYAVINHLAIGGDGAIYGILGQERRWKPRSEDAEGDHVLNEVEEEEGAVFLTQPYVRVDPATGRMEEILVDPALQRRAKSICTNAVTGHVFMTFMVGEGLVRHDVRRGRQDVLTGAQMGIVRPSGVTDIPGEPRIVVCGSRDGMAIIDAETLDVVARLPAKLHENAHISLVREG